MKRTLCFLIAGLVAFALASPAAAATNPPRASTSLTSLGVGSISGSTYVSLTGSAESYLEIPTSEWRAADWYTPLSNPAASDNAGIGVHVSHTVATFPALSSNQVTMTAATHIPKNALGAGTLSVVGEFSLAADDVAVSFTAEVIVNKLSTAFTWTATADTAVNVPSTAVDYPVSVTLSDAVTVNPGDEIGIRLYRSGGTTSTVYLRRLYGIFRPGFVLR